MNLKEKIEEGYKNSLQVKAMFVVNVHRSMKAEFLKLEKSGKELTETDYITTLKKMANQIKESIESFKKANRQDLIEKEERELFIIESYLPSEFTKNEITEKVRDLISLSAYVPTVKDMGKIIKQFKELYPGQADGKTLSDVVKEELSKANQ